MAAAGDSEARLMCNSYSVTKGQAAIVALTAPCATSRATWCSSRAFSRLHGAGGAQRA